MVAQNTLRLCEWKQPSAGEITLLLNTAFGVNKCIKQIKLSVLFNTYNKKRNIFPFVSMTRNQRIYKQ